MGDNTHIFVHCPSCGHGFKHEVSNTGKVALGLGGAAAGAVLGAKIGIVAGPLGGMAGTIPGAILGGLFGKSGGEGFDKPICPECSTKFSVPDNLT